MGMQTTLVHARPRRSLLATAGVTTALGMLPVFGLLYWFSADSGRWQVVLAAHVALLAACGVVALRQLRVFAAVTDGELVGNGIFSPVIRVPLDRVADVLLVDTYTATSPEVVTQLLVRDAEGRRLWRMRGNYWHRRDVEAIVACLPAPAVRVEESMSLTRFFRAYPGAAYWFEDRAALRVATIAGAVAVGVGASALLMAAVGVPLGFGR